jgi:hypothetical protein
MFPPLLTTDWHTSMLLRFCFPRVTWKCERPGGQA